MSSGIKLQIVGIRLNETVRNNAFEEIKDAKTYVDGYRLDELQINSVINSKKDIIDLIELLNIAKYSFLDKTGY